MFWHNVFKSFERVLFVPPESILCVLFELISVNFQIIKLECQVEKNEHFRHLLLFPFNRGSKVAKATRDVSTVYGEGAIAERTARDWYAKFKNGNFDLKDASRSGRPLEFDEERLSILWL